MWTSLILLCQLAYSVKASSLDSGGSIVKREISETLFENFQYFAQYSGAGYCPNDEDSAVDALVTCADDVCPLVESSGAYELINFRGDDTDQEGFVAIDPAKELIVISFRGSDSVANFIYDVLFTYTPCDFGDGCQAEYGFYESWLTVKDAVVSAVESAAASFPSYGIVSTGHSLGGAVATVAGAYLRDEGYAVDIYTFGSPRVFNEVGANYVAAQAGGNYRVTHLDDPVPRLPPILFGYAHVSPEYWLSDGTAETTNYNISDIEICTGPLNVACNAGEILFDVNAHLYYFEHISACDGGLLTSSKKRDLAENATAEANAEQKQEWAQQDIDYVNSL